MRSWMPRMKGYDHDDDCMVAGNNFEYVNKKNDVFYMRGSDATTIQSGGRKSDINLVYYKGLNSKLVTLLW